MKVGLVGLGSIGRRHLGNLLDLGCDVVAFDVSTEARSKAEASYPNARYVDSLPFAGLDAIVIATPIGNHLRWVEEAVARKLPFFVEKALGTLDQLPRWREIAAMELPVNQVGYNLRFQPKAERFKSWRDAIGGTFTLRCDMASWPGQSYGSPLLECSHEIDLALWCGAPPVVTYAKDGSVVLGESWWVSITTDAPGYWRDWSITNGVMGYQWAFDSPEDIGETMYHFEMAHFLECVREQKPTICPLSDGLKVLEVCAQIEQVAA